VPFCGCIFLRNQRLKKSNIFKRFTSFFEYFRTFYITFRTFSNVFERFYLAYFARLLHLNTPTPNFRLKTNIPPKITPKFSPKNPIFKKFKKIRSKNNPKIIDFFEILTC